MKIVHAKIDVTGKKNVFAADNVFSDAAESDFSNDDDLGDPELSDMELDDLEDDMGEDGRQNSSSIEMDNNITNHLIAECQNCHGIFISAMLASDQVIESINGVCPLCNKDTEQSLKWIIKDYPEE